MTEPHLINHSTVHLATSLRVVTYNIRGGYGTDSLRDSQRIASTIRAQNPAIVCLQEVHQRLPWSGWINQPGILSRALDMEVVFQKCVGWVWGGYGLGIATILPVLHVTRHKLKSVREPRGVLEVCLNWNGLPLRVFCTHWGLSREERAGQASQMAKFVTQGATPVIVCGDFNDTPEADYLQTFLLETNLCDAGSERNLPTYPADNPHARIDMVLYSPDLRPVRVDTVPTLASDHVPLVVELASADGRAWDAAVK